MKFRCGLILLVPKKYLYEAIAETLLLNVYEFNNLNGIVVDIGASIGDFTLFASQNAKVVYAFEPDPNYFQYLQKNIVLNKLSNVYSFKIYANSQTLEWLLTNKINQIDFLKMDCEGCEYEVLNCKKEILLKINQISMEIHNHYCINRQYALISKLINAGFKITQKIYHGCYYLLAVRS
jgi:tRNA G37 N-methylase Trm5